MPSGHFLYFENGTGWDFSHDGGVAVWGPPEKDGDDGEVQSVLAEFVNFAVKGAVFGVVSNVGGK